MQANLSLPFRRLAGPPFASQRERGVFLFGLLIAAFLIGCFAIEMVMGMPQWLVALPFAASLFFCGMPHGAMDWHIHRHLFGGRSLALTLLAFTPYTVVCVLATLVLVAAPVAYIAFFLLLTFLHFGRADARIRTRDASATIPETVRGVARGAAVAALPFAVQPVATADAIASISALVGGPPALPSGFAEVFGVFGAIGVAVWLLDSVLNSREASAAQRMLPLGVIATSALLPPLFSVGVWFLVWHAARECVVLGGDPRHPLRSTVRTHLRALPLMLPTLVLAAAVGVFAGASADMLGVAVVTLTLYAIFTPAHHLLQELAGANDSQFGTGAG